jgi:NAD(P)-dependent dehydrogenase (short-subunit alcohol dehydrogenase family)
MTSTGPAGAGERVVVVTGANRGIGLEVVRQLAVRGDSPVLAARDPDRGRAAAEDLRARDGVEVDVVRLDVTDPDSCWGAADEVRDLRGRVDVLVNNAAIDYDLGERASSADLPVVAEALDTNLLGAWRTTLAFLPLLRARGSARVVNVSSEAGSLTNMGGGTPAYSVSKTALNALTRMLAAELRPDGVLVNSVCPGWVATDMGGAGGRPVGDGAASVLWAVDVPDDGPTGGFFRDGRPLPW